MQITVSVQINRNDGRRQEYFRVTSKTVPGVFPSCIYYLSGMNSMKAISEAFRYL